MSYTLGTAAKATGRNKTTILRAIKDGKITALRDVASGAWRIEPVELHRVYPAIAEATPDATAGNSDAMAELRARLADKDGVIEDLRDRLTESERERRQTAERLHALLADSRAVPDSAASSDAPPSDAPPRRRRWWPWRR
jgi:uncharacterized coiled-coil protein SlyX